MKVFARLFQKAAQSRARSPRRRPQTAKPSYRRFLFAKLFSLRLHGQRKSVKGVCTVCGKSKKALAKHNAVIKELDAKTVIDKERQDRLLAYDSQLKKEMSGLKSEIYELKKQIAELEKKKADNE